MTAARTPPAQTETGRHPTLAHLPLILRIRAVQRLMIATLCGLAAGVVLYDSTSRFLCVLVAWNVGAWVYLILAGLLIARADAETTHLRVRLQDQSAIIISALVLSASIACAVSIGLLINEVKHLVVAHQWLLFGLSVFALASSWLLIHTLFTFHYAHLYYRAHRKGRERDPGGLKFPNEPKPTYMDFAYFSFVIGMTSQVSDVAIECRSLRRLALMHGLLAFAFNVAILATSINIIATLIGNASADAPSRDQTRTSATRN